MRKPVFGVFDQVRLKPACSASAARKRLEISDTKTRGIILSKQWTTKVLIRLRGSAGWSAPLLLASWQKQAFSWRGSYCLNRFCHNSAYWSKRLFCEIQSFTSTGVTVYCCTLSTLTMLVSSSLTILTSQFKLSVIYDTYLYRCDSILLYSLYTDYVGLQFTHHPHQPVQVTCYLWYIPLQVWQYIAVLSLHWLCWSPVHSPSSTASSSYLLSTIHTSTGVTVYCCTLSTLTMLVSISLTILTSQFKLPVIYDTYLYRCDSILLYSLNTDYVGLQFTHHPHQPVQVICYLWYIPLQVWQYIAVLSLHWLCWSPVHSPSSPASSNCLLSTKQPFLLITVLVQVLQIIQRFLSYTWTSV